MSPVRPALVAVLLAGLAVIGTAQSVTRFRYELTGNPIGGVPRAAPAGDVNADGIPDYMAATTNGVNAGRVLVFSGADGSVLHAFAGAGASGISLSSLGDIDGDGHDDIIYALGHDPSVSSTGIAAKIRSGATGALIVDKYYPPGLPIWASVTGLGDVDGDTIPDYAIGFPRQGTSGAGDGRVEVYSGATHAVIRSFAGAPGDQLGWSLANAGDVDSDGVDDLLIGAPQGDSSGNALGSGRAEVRSGATGALIHSFPGNGLAATGYEVDGIGDVNGDGIPDLLLGEPGGFSPGGAGYVGRARVMSGATGALLKSFVLSGSQLGHSVDGLGDVTGDGVPDYAIGVAAVIGVDSSRTYSGATNAPVDLFGHPSGFLTFPSHFAQDMARIGDLDGDGIGDFVLAEMVKEDASSPLTLRVRAFLGGRDPVVSYQSASSSTSMTLTWHPEGGLIHENGGDLICTGATPGGLGIALVSLAAADYPIFGTSLLVAVDNTNFLFAGTLGANAAGAFAAGNVSRSQPYLVGSPIHVQFFQTSPVVRASNGLRFIAIP
ncbi:MAG: FG-GAP repeat protein [Planctomycetes bacterium]|nr:FG-GAP repeat protein [Planctomycetota bacterium]